MAEIPDFTGKYLGIIVLFFTVYAFTRDFVDNPSKAFISMLLAIFAVFVIVILGMYLYHKTK